MVVMPPIYRATGADGQKGRRGPPVPATNLDIMECLDGRSAGARLTARRQRNRRMPRWRYVGRSQRPLTRGWGLFGSSSLFVRRGLLVELGGDEFIDRARAGFGFVADSDGDFAAHHAGAGPAFTEPPHIGH